MKFLLVLIVILLVSELRAEPKKVVLLESKDLAGLGEIDIQPYYIGKTKYGYLYDYDKSLKKTKEYVANKKMAKVFFENAELEEVLHFLEHNMNQFSVVREVKSPRYKIYSNINQKISLNLNDVSLLEVLQFISKKIGADLIIDPFVIRLNRNTQPKPHDKNE